MTAQLSPVEFERNKPYTVIVSVTPEIAQRWLTQNTHNRKARQATVNSYARDMAAGNWKMTGESIKFSNERVLLDGQHRLRGVVKSGVTVQMFVTYNLPPDAQNAMDTGSKRTASDALALDGEQHTALLASISRLAISVEVEGPAVAGRYQVTNAEVAEFLTRNPEVRMAAEFACSVARRTDCPPSVVGYTYWVLAKINEPDAARFWVDAADKVGLTAGHPVIALTNRFAESRRNRETLPKSAYLSLIYRAWNMWRAGKTMRMIRVNSAAGGLITVPEPK